jgi:hypothetical protein
VWGQARPAQALARRPKPGFGAQALNIQSGLNMASTWPQHGLNMASTINMASTWPQHGLNMASTWPQPSTWPQHGLNMASTWPQHSPTRSQHCLNHAKTQGFWASTRFCVSPTGVWLGLCGLHTQPPPLHSLLEWTIAWVAKGEGPKTLIFKRFTHPYPFKYKSNNKFASWGENQLSWGLAAHG